MSANNGNMLDIKRAAEGEYYPAPGLIKKRLTGSQIVWIIVTCIGVFIVLSLT